MWQVKGCSKNVEKSIIAPFSRKRSFMDLFYPHTIQEVTDTNKRRGFAGISALPHVNATFPIVYHVSPEKIAELRDGDILRIDASGTVQRLFSYGSDQNALFMTEFCNSRCIMCPQPQLPIDHSDEVMMILRCIPKKMLRKICLTGGEPTVSTKLFDVLRKLKTYPFVEPIILTNGRMFSDKNFTKEFIKNAPFNMVYAIPLYSSIPIVHDQIVGCEDAFQETIRGIYHLTEFRVPIELRIVLLKKNVFNVPELAEYIGWNLPMLVHVAFMGMEVSGRANDHIHDVWIEPADYMENLLKAVKILHYRNINVSIYNLPLCLLPYGLRQYSRLSISSWKQGYVSECQNCIMKNNCCGFFTTSSIIPKGVHPITEMPR